MEILLANSLSVYGGTLERFGAESSLEIVAANRTPRRVDRIRAELSSTFANEPPIVNREMYLHKDTGEPSSSVSSVVQFPSRMNSVNAEGRTAPRALLCGGFGFIVIVGVTVASR